MPKTGYVRKETAAMGKIGRTRLGIVFGGRSGEHEVSLASAASVISALDADEYDITVIGITKEGKIADTIELRNMLPAALLDRVRISMVLATQDSTMRVCSEVAEPDGNSRINSPKMFFPLLHGPYGEDGTLQGLFEMAGLPYVGCGVLASSLAMDKDMAKRLLSQAGLPVVPYKVVYTRDLEKNMKTIKRSIPEELGYPLFSKPANLGSSVGIRKILEEDEFEEAVRHTAQYDRKILIEKGIDGREIECAILGNDHPEASVVGEVIPANDFYDYEAKYISLKSRLEIPARIDDKKADAIRAMAIQSFKLIEGSGLARIDFFLERDTGTIWLNEINTMPGFTPISMYSKLWAASGIPFEKLVSRLVDLGEERYLERSGGRIQA
jgi:D-alanine-D-alanine ligase